MSTPVPIEDLREKLAALPKKDRAKVARFAGVSPRGVEYFADGSTVSPNVATYNAMVSGFERFQKYERERAKLAERFPELQDEGKGDAA